MGEKSISLVACDILLAKQRRLYRGICFVLLLLLVVSNLVWAFIIRCPESKYKKGAYVEGMNRVMTAQATHIHKEDEVEESRVI